MDSPALLLNDLKAQLLTKTKLINDMVAKAGESGDAEVSYGASNPKKADYGSLAAMVAEDGQKDRELARVRNELKTLQAQTADLQQERAKLEGKLGTLEVSSARSAAEWAAAPAVPSPNPATQSSQLQTPPPSQRPAGSRSGSENYPWSRPAASANTTPREPLGGSFGMELTSFGTPAVQGFSPSITPPSSIGVPRRPPATVADRAAPTPTNVYAAPIAYPTVYATPPAASRELRSPQPIPTPSKPDEGFSGDMRALTALCDANPALKTMWFLNEATIANVSQWPGVTCSERGNKGRVFGLKLNIQVLPEAIGELTALLTLDLSNCFELEAIPDAIGSLRSLTTLKLMSCSKVQRLPESIGKLSELKTLSLGGCERLATLPNGLGDMQALRQLDLWRCSSLVRVPDSIGNLQRLEKLKLMRCSSLATLPERMGDLRSLTMIDLWECSSLVALPSRLGDLANLTKLDLRGCNALKKESGGALSRLRAKNCEIVFEAAKTTEAHPASLQSIARTAGR